jgi:biopolymer transport protein ExbD
VQLPQVSAAQPLSNPPDEIVVNVYADGRLLVSREELSRAELQDRLTTARERYAEQAVLIRGDGGASFQQIADVLAVCHAAQIRNFSLATQLDSE